MKEGWSRQAIVRTFKKAHPILGKAELTPPTTLSTPHLLDESQASLAMKFQAEVHSIEVMLDPAIPNWHR